ncbi:MAG: helix-turn-helix domain-containing protein [Faecalispora jeddahensis]
MILDNIKRLCRERKTNITNLEKEVGIGFGTVYKWGKVSPSVDNLKLVADYFGVTVDYLLAENDTTGTVQ